MSDGGTDTPIPVRPKRVYTPEQAKRKSEYERQRWLSKGVKECEYEGCAEPKERGVGIKYCSAHRLTTRKYTRDPRCRWDGCEELKVPGAGSKYCAHHRLEAREVQRLRNKSYVKSEASKERQRAARKVKRAELALLKPPKPVKPSKIRAVPMEVQDAYRIAKPNSIIRQKFPTWEKLRANYWKEAA